MLAYSWIEESSRDAVVRPHADHQAKAKTQTNENQPSSICRSTLSSLCGSLSTGKGKPEKHDGSDEFTEHS